MKNFVFVFIIAILFSCETQTSQNSQSQADEASLSKEEYVKKGKEIASQTFSVLSSHLQQAMKEGGVSQAIKHCNLAAMPLVDSLSEVHNARIRRTSLKLRNPQDAPTYSEQAILESFAKAKMEGKSLEPLVQKNQEGLMAFYAPIIINDQCLRCHGVEGETLDGAGYALIRELYPEDEATGYQAGDLRGMWSITFQ